jgi:hypothetical protein
LVFCGWEGGHDGGVYVTQHLMRRLHFVAGTSTALAFFGSGAYMMFVGYRDYLTSPDRELLYVSRHIYMLGPSLVNLVLAVYVRLIQHPRVPRLQWAGTIFLLLSSVLLVTAFVVEPIVGWGRTPVSAFGIFFLWAGAILHVIAPRLGRMKIDLAQRHVS